MTRLPKKSFIVVIAFDHNEKPTRGRREKNSASKSAVVDQRQGPTRDWYRSLNLHAISSSRRGFCSWDRNQSNKSPSNSNSREVSFRGASHALIALISLIKTTLWGWLWCCCFFMNEVSARARAVWLTITTIMFFRCSNITRLCTWAAFVIFYFDGVSWINDGNDPWVSETIQREKGPTQSVPAVLENFQENILMN